MTNTASVPEWLAQYTVQRDTARTNAVTALLTGLSERELLLVKEAAVMAWVQGIRHSDLKMPGDRQVLFTVVDACRAFPDLYPTITNYRPASLTSSTPPAPTRRGDHGKHL